MRYALAILLWCLGLGAPAQLTRRSLGSAEWVPLPRIDGAGGTVTLSDFGGPQVLYFYGEDCADCVEQLAYLQRLAAMAGGRHFRVLAVAVSFSAPARPRRPVDLGQIIHVVDEGGQLWSRLQELPLIDSPPGARARSPRVLPLTVFVGRWAVRHHGTSRLPLDTFVSRRMGLLNAVMLMPPGAKEIDIDDEEALRTFQWPATPRTAREDGGTAL